jgi:hypothetical protein
MTPAVADDVDGSGTVVGPAHALRGQRCGGEGDVNQMRLPAVLHQCGATTLFVRTRARVAGLAIVLVQAMLFPLPSQAQTTGTPMTAWSFLGVPNPFGTNAAAQKSDNPAIQAAAKAKAAKHEICKKKAAIKYLAGLGCTPEHPEVMPALMAAMDDPDEQVRYEAVKAVLQTAAVCQSRDQKKETCKTKGISESCADAKKAIEKQFCKALDRLCGKAPPKEHKHKLKKAMKSRLGGECEDPAKEDCPCADRRGSCCSPDMRDKLMKLAYGRDDMGCFLEPSKRVRDLAEQALNACNACACGCEGMMGTQSGMDNIVREMPPVDDRETRPSDNIPLPLGGACYGDRLVVPPQMDHHEMVPTPVPFLEPEVIPAPDAAMVLPGTRSVLVRATASAPAGPFPSEPGRFKAIWHPLDPVSPFAETDAEDVRDFLCNIEQRQPSARIAGQPSQPSAGHRHAETRIALAPTAASRGMPQPIVRPVIRIPIAPLPAPTPPPVIRAVPPASPSPATGLTGSDRLRWMTLACLTAALAIAIFGRPRAKPAATVQSAPSSRVMMRRRVHDPHLDQRNR